MLARDRGDLLVDPGTSFLELSPLAAYGLFGGDVHSASVVTGVGRILGRECVILANHATVKGGPHYPMTVKGVCAQDIARQNNLSRAYMVDSGGALLPMRGEIFPDERQKGATTSVIAADLMILLHLARPAPMNRAVAECPWR
jgi:3-methylcrotonyl-CoA carboxylase beta subunit